MATIVASTETAGLSFGRVLERALGVVRHNPLVTIGLVVLFAAVPSVASYVLLTGVNRMALVMTVAGYALPGSIALFLANWFVSQLVGVIAQGAMALPILAEEEGRRASFGESAANLLRSLPSLLLFGALLGVGVEIGTTLLIVPGVLIYLMWAVAPSAIAIEGEGMFMALNRSQELTEGARWKMFGIFLLLAIFNMLAGVVLVFARTLAGFSLADARLSIGYLITVGLMSLVVNLLWSTVQASLYVELVRWKEGGSPEKLAEVFA